MSNHVPHVDIFHSLGDCNGPGLLKGFDRCVREVGHFIRGRKAGEVERGILSEIAHHPLAHPFDVIHLIVKGRDDQIHNFEMFVYPFNGPKTL